MHQWPLVRDYDEEDPKKPRPVPDQRARRTPAVEATEQAPWSHIRKDADRDHQRHVC